MNRRFAMFALLVGAVAGAYAASPMQTPSVVGTLAAVDRSVYQCEPADQATQCRRQGNAADLVAGEAVTEIVLLYRGDTLARAVYVVHEAGFDALIGKLSAAFGPPMPGREMLRAGMAGVFENRYYIWRRGGQVWFAEQFFERVTTSGLWHMDAAEFAALLAERDRARGQGARDL